MFQQGKKKKSRYIGKENAVSQFNCIDKNKMIDKENVLANQKNIFNNKKNAFSDKKNIFIDRENILTNKTDKKERIKHIEMRKQTGLELRILNNI